MKKFISIFFIIFLLSIAVISSYKILTTMNDYRQADKIYNELKTQKQTSKNNTINLSNINKDYICWINIENTNIDYPVVKSNDNSYYLHKDIYRNYLYSGTIFIDYRCNYDTSKNLIFYGHNMKNKTMFSELEKFKDKDFFYSNPKITITDKDTSSNYEVFAVILVHKDFDYIIYNFNNETDYEGYLNKIINKSLYKTNNNPTNKDKIITLSTCSYEFDNARTVVFAKKV